MTDRDGMYVHVTAKGAMSFRMECQPMSWLRSTMQPSRLSRNGHPISTAFRFRSGAKDPERNTLRNAVINWPDGEEGEKSHFRDGLPLTGSVSTAARSAANKAHGRESDSDGRRPTCDSKDTVGAAHEDHAAAAPRPKIATNTRRSDA